MRKKRYETLLPLKYNDGRPVSDELFEQTREELVAQFGAICLQPNVVRGIWVHEGIQYEDPSGHPIRRSVGPIDR